jgi:uracil-DNA glycosylase
MNIDIHHSWTPYLNSEFEKPYFKDLIEFVQTEYRTTQCFPQQSDMFNAFNHSHFENTRVVIIGQDPYHGIDQANGLCFSVNDGVSHPPSLINIFKEIDQDLGFSYPKNGNLMPWADQGVLLLNAILSVRAHQAGSHQKKGWEQFTDAVIEMISKEKTDVVFLLWGGFARKKKKLIDSSKHFVLESGHPSPLSANRGYWFGNKHFSKVNYLLEQVGSSGIEWELK